MRPTVWYCSQQCEQVGHYDAADSFIDDSDFIAVDIDDSAYSQLDSDDELTNELLELLDDQAADTNMADAGGRCTAQELADAGYRLVLAEQRRKRRKGHKQEKSGSRRLKKHTSSAHINGIFDNHNNQQPVSTYQTRKLYQRSALPPLKAARQPVSVKQHDSAADTTNTLVHVQRSSILPARSKKRVSVNYDRVVDIKCMLMHDHDDMDQVY